MHSVAFVTLSYMTGFVRVRFSLPLDHAALFVKTVLPAVMLCEVPSGRVSEADATALEQFLPAVQGSQQHKQANLRASHSRGW
jgi:hypothetical protein